MVLVLGFTIGLTASASILGRPAATEASPTPQTVTVRAGSLSRTLRSVATAEWTTERRLYSPTTGIITQLQPGPGFLHPGDVLLRVDERPLVAVPGEVPAYRPLEEGARGRDVAALQRFLAAAGYVVDAAVDRFTAVTTRAVREWQQSLGLPPTGVVLLGDVLFVPPDAFGVPTRWVGDVALGATVAAGMPLAEVLSSQPVLSVEFGASLPPEMTPGLRGEAIFPNGDRRGVTLVALEEAPGRLIGWLGPTAVPLCRAEACLDLVPLSGATGVAVEWVIVPETSGPLLPVAALLSDASGGAFVQLPDGSRRPVVVRVVSGGMAIVTGVEVGETVLLP